MGFFDIKETVGNTVNDILSNFNYSYKDSLRSFDFSNYIDRFGDEEKLCQLIIKLARKNIDITTHIDFVTYMHSFICIKGNSLEENSIFRELFSMYLNNPDLFMANDNFSKVLNSFGDKRIVLEYFNFLTHNDQILKGTSNDNLSLLINYVSEARQYYVDDRALLSSAMSLVRSVDPAVLKYGKKEDIDTIVYKKLSEDKKANGIYDIDQSILADMDVKMQELDSFRESLQTLVNLAEEQIKALKVEIIGGKDELKNARIRELEVFKNAISEKLQKFNTDYAELLSQQKSNLSLEKESIIDGFNDLVENEKRQLNLLYKKLDDMTVAETERIRQAANAAISKIDEHFSSNEKISEFFRDSKANEEFMGKVAQIEEVAQQVSDFLTQQGAISADGKIILPDKKVMVPDQMVVAPNIILPKETRKVDSTVNYFFDDRIPFEIRYSKLMKLKKDDMQKNSTIYHEKFDLILKLLIENIKPPYLYGPSGCGKTYIVQKQIANLLGANVIINGYVTYEQEILGYMNAGDGEYVPTNLYNAYKYGDIIFYDEIDISNAKASGVLHNFIGMGSESYVFPNGERVFAHPNFRFISAGNTNGNGRTYAYNTREKFDSALLNRITPIELGYDDSIDEHLLEEYAGWDNFIVNYRRTIDSVTRQNSDAEKLGTFTNRDTAAIRRYKDNHSLTDEEIMELEIFSTKDVDSLNKIFIKLTELEKDGAFTEEGKKILKLFKKSYQGRCSDG